jgi:hypothetical protein
MTNILFYAIDTDIDSIDPTLLTDEGFVFEAEKQGKVWDAKDFQTAFNSGEISDFWYLRILNKYSINN